MLKDTFLTTCTVWTCIELAFYFSVFVSIQWKNVAWNSFVVNIIFETNNIVWDEYIKNLWIKKTQRDIAMKIEFNETSEMLIETRWKTLYFVGVRILKAQFDSIEHYGGWKKNWHVFQHKFIWLVLRQWKNLKSF